MANYPSGITLSNTACIVEITDDALTNTPQVQGMGTGYIRQLGISCYIGEIDDCIQYNTIGTFQFQQSGITYAYVEAVNFLFVQDPLSL